MFDRVVIVKKLDDPNAPSVYHLEVAIRNWCSQYDIPVFNDELPEDGRSLFVSLGGDGTFLYTARRSLLCDNSSVIGINLGRKGFLAEDDLNVDGFLDAIKKGRAREDRRMVLAVVNKQGVQHVALNEVLLSAADGGALSGFQTQVFINGSLVTEQFSSGVMVATSTGSTAFSLSEQGALITPNTNVMQILPVASHTLTSRPVVTSGRDTVTIKVPPNNRVKKFNIVIDGNIVNTNEVRCLQIERYPRDVIVWRHSDWNFFNVLSEKMGW